MARILIVEDEDHIAQMIAATLSLGGHTSARCADGGQALPIIEAGGFDLVLLDVMLPGLDESGGDELSNLARDMNLMAQAVQERVEQLEAVAEERKVFIGNLAHEMKTPLTSILGFVDLLYLPKEVPDEQRVEYARVISEEAKRLRALSGKLL